MATDDARICAVVEQALELPAEERDELLAARLEGEELAEARRLLVACLQEDGFLTRGDRATLGPLLERLSEAACAGAQVGPFRIQRLISSGGMADVFEAEQRDPLRQVALKLMRTGLGDVEAQRRFRFEVETLAQLHHPAIAEVYEAGTHAILGVETPYFAMELVEGAAPITAYANAHAWGPNELVRALIAVCEGVQHGHQKGVLHRDLKPANILVDAEGRPRIIDYGIARAADPTSRGSLRLTTTGAILGTLAYMSPEQLRGEDERVDTRSDVYALGVVLYELLTGRPPFEVGEKSLSELTRSVCELPPRDPRSLDPRVPRELGWIALRALAKEPGRRYPSAAELRADLERFQLGHPVAAGPPTRRYRLRKLIARHKALSATTSLLVASLLAAVIGTSTGLAEARAQRTLSEEALARQRAINAYMVETFRAVHPAEEGREVTLFQALERTADLRQRIFHDEPALRASLERTLASLYTALDQGPQAEELAREALAELEARLGPDDPETIEARFVLGGVLLDRKLLDEAEVELAAARDAFARVEGPGSIGALRARLELADLAIERGRYREAAEQAEVLLHEPGLSPERAGLDRFRALQLSSRARFELGELERAEEVARESLAQAEELYGPEHPVVLAAQQSLGNALRRRSGVTDEAIELQRGLHERSARVLGAEHRATLAALDTLAQLLNKASRLDESEPLLRELREVHGRRAGELHLDTLIARHNLATCVAMRGRLDEAIEELRGVLADLERAGHGEERIALGVQESLARTLIRTPRREEALEEHRRHLELAEVLLAPEDWELAKAHFLLGRCLIYCGDPDEALDELQRALEDLQEQEGELPYRYTTFTLQSLAELRGRRGEPAERIAALRELVALYDEHGEEQFRADWAEVLQEAEGR